MNIVRKTALAIDEKLTEEALEMAHQMHWGNGSLQPQPTPDKVLGQAFPSRKLNAIDGVIVRIFAGA
jgi:hypothetical protein